MSQTRKNKKDKLINLKYRIPFLKLITGIGILMLISGSLIYLKTSNKSEDSIAQLEEVSQTEEQNIEEIARSITVKVVSGSGGGSGVIIRKEGQLSSIWYTKPTDTGLVMNCYSAPLKYTRSVISGFS